MNSNQILLTTLLSAVLRDRNIDNIDNIDLRNPDWKALYEEAAEHEVHTLIFPLIKKLNLKDSLGKAIMSKWERHVLMAGMSQLEHVEQMKALFNELSKENIKFIPLKGLVLRELYPIPEMRTMGDADILVCQKDLKKACKLLANMGYKKVCTDSKHIHFEHDTYLSIEIHFLLLNKGLLRKNLDEFEAGVWQNAKTGYVCDTTSMILSLEDQILHLIFHMAAHLTSTGFGLRQLCDLCVLVENKYYEINWDNIYDKTFKYGIITFTSVLFMVCSKLFNMSIPEKLNMPNIEWNYANALIEDIFSGGIFGGRTSERIIGGIQLHYTNHIQNIGVSTPFRNLTAILFPPVKNLGIQYSYAKRFPILAPAAWFHRFLYGIFRNDFTLSEKKSLIAPSSSASKEMKIRAKLLHQLDLK